MFRRLIARIRSIRSRQVSTPAVGFITLGPLSAIGPSALYAALVETVSGEPAPMNDAEADRLEAERQAALSWA